MKPPLGQLKLNSDASIFKGLAFGGSLVRNDEGKFVFAYYKEFGECDVLLAEA